MRESTETRSVRKSVVAEEDPMMAQYSCPSCREEGLSIFYEARDVPAHSVLLLPTREAAMNYPRGNIKLGFCSGCGFITNVSFDPSLHEYSSHYEETQGFSNTFSTFHRDLAQRLIERYDLHNKDIIEIGCGKGEFLTMLCELGPNRGVGFDPAFVSERNQSPAKHRMTFVQDFYSEKYSDYKGDFVCCKMTLEHIHDVADFVHTVRRAIGDRKETVVFFQVPDAVRILRELAFWDIYYEHCSYFSMGSLARLFRGCGFDVVNLAKEYDGQYLMIEARPSGGKGGSLLSQEDDLDGLRRDVAYFAESCQQKVDAWRGELQKIIEGGRRAVIWGAGSKGVAFLTKLNIQKEIEYAVDINPYKRGTYVAGTGQEIVGPEFLRTYKPDVVIAMNPIYRAEIQKDLQELGVAAQLVAL